MIKENDNTRIVSFEDADWQAVHDCENISGPVISLGNQEIVRDISNYNDDEKDSLAMVKYFKDFNKGMTSVINCKGYLTLGSEFKFEHHYKYSGNRVRVTTDVQIPSRSTIQRHFGIGSLFLPGEWKKMIITPPAQHLAEGDSTYSQKIPKATSEKQMIAHWHRPPLSVIFESKEHRIEIGTGTDVWRWEENLGYHKESGSYKIFLEEDGLRFIREPLMCCEEFMPEGRTYRFSWYMAWDKISEEPSLPEHAKLILKFNKDEANFSDLLYHLKEKKSSKTFVYVNLRDITWQNSMQRYKTPFDVLEKKGEDCCFSNKSVPTKIKKIFRKLIEIKEIDGIVFRDFKINSCYMSNHVGKKHKNGTVHTDIAGIVDLVDWIMNLAKKKMPVYIAPSANHSPFLTGLFK